MLDVADGARIQFDTVQMPLNVMDAHYRSFEKLVLPELVKHGNRRAGHEEHGERDHFEVGDGDAGRVSALRAEPADVRGDHRASTAWRYSIRPVQRLSRFKPLGRDEVEALLGKTARAASTGRYEPFKTTSIFDGTAQNPEWLGEEPAEVQGLMPA